MYSLTERETQVESECGVEYGISSKQGFCIDCISTDKNAVVELITELNKGCAEECHFMDIVEDWLDDKFTTT